jgi:hypothetical protein
MIFIKKSFGLALSFTFFTLISSCSKGKSDNSVDPVRATRGAGNSSGLKVKSCHQQKILKILNNAKSVISRKSSGRSLVKWNINSGKESQKFSTPINPDQISNQGNYLLRKVSYSKYQVLKFNDKITHSLANINLNSFDKPAPKVNFSQKGEFISFLYRPYVRGLKKQIQIYSLRQKRSVFNLVTDNIYFAEIDITERYLFTGEFDGKNKFLKKYDLKTKRLIFKKNLSVYSNYTKAIMGKNVLLLKDQYELTAFSVKSGEELYKLNNSNIFDIDPTGEFIITSDYWKEIKVLNLNNGREVISVKKEKGLVMATCQLTSSPLKVTCLDSSDRSRILIWNLENNIKTTSCY